MRDTVTSGAWIPVVKETFNAWYWIDGTKYSECCFKELLFKIQDKLVMGVQHYFHQI